jgi:carboxyl-terminal processing protease
VNVRLAALLSPLVILVAGIAGVGAQAPAAAETFDAVWKIVRDNHFDPAFDVQNWDRIKAELRPKAVAAGTPGELRAVLADMLGRLGLSHFAVLPSTPDVPGSRGDLSGEPGLEFRVLQKQLIVTSVEEDGGAAAAGVRPGWIVQTVGRTPLAPLLSAIPDGPAARMAELAAWRAALSKLRGPADSPIEITFIDGSGASVTKAVRLHPEHGEPVTVGSLPTMYVRVTSAAARTPHGADAGVIAFNVWMTPVNGPFQQAIDRFRRADGLVIDLRGNPGGLAGMIMGLSGYFLPERLTLGIMKTRGTELKFVSIPRLVDGSGERVEPFSGPVAILVDGLTASASECFAGGLQSLGRVRVFGQTTMGQALPALFDRLPNGDVFIHAWGDFVTGSGVRLEGRGVIPDEPVSVTREDLLAGRDRPLEAALAWIDRTKSEPRKTPSEASVRPSRLRSN